MACGNNGSKQNKKVRLTSRFFTAAAGLRFCLDFVAALRYNTAVMRNGERIMIKADYYDKFKCKCGDCRSVCCGGWGITVSDEEYFRLIGLDCPAELRYILDCALAVVDDPCPERYAMMKPSYTGKCRLINEEGLCSLQIACGEEVLPAVCRMYPRSLTENHAGCSASCERVVEMLMRAEPLSFSSPLPRHAAPHRG